MLFFNRSCQVLCLSLCALLPGCDGDKNAAGKSRQVNHVRNNYTNNGMAGWVWQGTGNDVEAETQIWQLTFPITMPSWTSPDRIYPPLFPDQRQWDIKTTGDFSGDGSADFLWRHKTTGAWRVWQLQHGLRTGQNSLPDFDADHAWTVSGAADTDRDGDDDIILNRNTTGEVLIWEMQNHAIVATHVVGKKAGYRVNRIGDFNRDGDADLLLRQTGTDKLVIWEIETNTFVQERTFGNTGKGWNPVCAADLDNDGDDDIMLLNSANNQEKWFVIENYARLRQEIGAGNTGYKFLGCGDYDADGDADTLWQNESDARLRVILQQNYGARKQTIYTNPFGSQNPAHAGYGFEYRANNN
jgi:hypothetical protein